MELETKLTIEKSGEKTSWGWYIIPFFLKGFIQVVQDFWTINSIDMIRLGVATQIVFCKCSSRSLGKWSQFDVHIFQMGGSTTNQKSWYEQIGILGMLDVGIPIIDVNIDEWKGDNSHLYIFYISTRADSWFLRRVEITYHNWCFLRVGWRPLWCVQKKTKIFWKKQLTNQKRHWSSESLQMPMPMPFSSFLRCRAVLVVFKSLR